MNPSKVSLGGGGIIVVGLAIYQSIAPQSRQLGPKGCLIAFLSAIIFSQLWHGLTVFRGMHPRFVVRHPKQELWTGPIPSPGVGYYFEVFNPSKNESLESVKAHLISIDSREINNLPVPLHIRHKLYETTETEVSLAAGDTVGFDLVTGPYNNLGTVVVPHVVAGATGVTKCSPISGNKCRLTVRVFAKDCPPQDVSFEVWVEDKFLRCEPCQIYVMGAL